MVRSLYAGISGLRSHQVALDVTGNNIANVNTVGFKAGRATFKESMAQMLQGPSRPAGDQGGRNPLQVGLGTSIGSIDTMMRQGNLQTTGQITDLALEGRAYFAFSTGSATYYSRNGGMQLDSTGRLVSPTTGWALQGRMADAYGNYPPTGVFEDIRIPWGEKAPAKATTQIDFQCNLNSDSEALGTVTHTNTFLANANVADPNGTGIASRGYMTHLFDENGNSLGIREGDVLSVSWADDGRVMRFPIEPDEITGELPTLEDFRQSLQGYLNRIATGDETATDVVVSFNADGGFNITNNSGTPLNGLMVNMAVSRGETKSQVTNAFRFPPSVGSGDTYSMAGLRVPATEDDYLSDIFDAQGRELGFENGDRILISGEVGGRIRDGGLVYVPNGGTYTDPATGEVYSGGTTMRDLLYEIQSAFSLPPTDGTIYNRPSVEMNQDIGNTGFAPLGSILLRGLPETGFALTALKVRGMDGNYEPPSPTRFTSNMEFTEIQTARDTGVRKTSLIVFDDSGAPHNVTMTFTHTGRPSEWLWEMTIAGDQRIVGGNRGTMTFTDGTPSSFTYDDNSNAFTFEPMNGASQVSIRLNVGSPGSVLGVTQFDSPSTTVMREQDGYEMGKLVEISIDEKGEISGVYSNNITKSIAQIYVADFNNPAGLLKMGNSMYAVSNNSGSATMQQPTIGTSTKIAAGSLEMSNVELETEFTNMITIQRGYQSNARVITTSDQMLQELVQLVR